MSNGNHIEIKGLEPLLKALKNLPDEVNASVIRNIARKPGNRVVSLARKLFTPKDTGATKRSFGILKVKNRMQRFIEVGIKGRSLAYIFIKGAPNRTKSSGASTGSIPAIGNVVKGAAEQLQSSVQKEMAVDISKTIARGLKKYLR